MRVTYYITCASTYSPSSSTPISRLIAMLGVPLYAPITFYKHFFYILIRGFIIFFTSSFLLGYILYTYALYLITSLVTTIYRSFDLFIKGPYVNTIIRAILLNKSSLRLAT